MERGINGPHTPNFLLMHYDNNYAKSYVDGKGFWWQYWHRYTYCLECGAAAGTPCRDLKRLKNWPNGPHRGIWQAHKTREKIK